MHETLGPGLLESVYRPCLEVELTEVGFTIEKNRKVPLVYRDRALEGFFLPDLIVNGVVVVELKAIERIAAVHVAQLITYLKLTGLPAGLLMNFNVALLKSGTRRVVRPDLYVKRNTPVLSFSRSPV